MPRNGRGASHRHPGALAPGRRELFKEHGIVGASSTPSPPPLPHVGLHLRPLRRQGPPHRPARSMEGRGGGHPRRLRPRQFVGRGAARCGATSPTSPDGGWRWLQLEHELWLHATRHPRPGAGWPTATSGWASRSRNAVRAWTELATCRRPCAAQRCARLAIAGRAAHRVGDAAADRPECWRRRPGGDGRLRPPRHQPPNGR